DARKHVAGAVGPAFAEATQPIDLGVVETQEHLVSASRVGRAWVGFSHWLSKLGSLGRTCQGAPGRGERSPALQCHQAGIGSAAMASAGGATVSPFAKASRSALISSGCVEWQPCGTS